MWSKAQKFGYEKHSNQWYGDQPYYHHLRNVFDTYKQINTTVDYWKDHKLGLQLCWLHDTLEDCGDVTIGSLLEEGFSKELVEAIDAISKREGETKGEYLVRCSFNKVAWRVKVADTLSNLTESVKEGNIRRINLYSKQLYKLYLLGGEG